MSNPVASDLRHLTAAWHHPSRAWPVALALILTAGLAAPREARADEKQACLAAYDALQALQHKGHLREAHEQAISCVQNDACAPFMHADCLKWLGEIESSQPTVVLDVRVAGQETTAARVSLDGKPWLDKLDGTAQTIDPGEHRLHVEVDGASAVDQMVVIHEGEKHRAIDVTFQTPPAIAPTAPRAPTPGTAPDVDVVPGAATAPSVTPWVFGGVGIAGLALGGILTGVLVSEKATTNAECAATCNHPTGQAAAKTIRTLGPITTVGYIVGGVALGVSVVLFATRQPATSRSPVTSLTTGPLVTANGSGWRLQGSW